MSQSYFKLFSQDFLGNLLQNLRHVQIEKSRKDLSVDYDSESESDGHGIWYGHLNS